MATYEDENLDRIISPLLLSEIVSITQDELLFYVKNSAVKAWSLEDESQLCQKSQGL
ncbi:7594_t:CDS:1, partial [Cetraspora pellucida]